MAQIYKFSIIFVLSFQTLITYSTQVVDSPTDIWNLSVVSAFDSENRNLQVKIKELVPESEIQAYEVYELGLDSSSHISAPKENLVLAKKRGVDPVSGMEFFYAKDQFERNDLLKNQAYNSDHLTFNFSSSEGTKLFQLSRPTNVHRILLDRLASNSDYLSDSSGEILTKSHLTEAALKCAYIQFEELVSWLSSSPSLVSDFNRLGVKLNRISFEILNLEHINDESIADVLYFGKNNISGVSDRYLGIKDYSLVTKKILDHMNISIIMQGLRDGKNIDEVKWLADKVPVLQMSIAVGNLDLGYDYFDRDKLGYGTLDGRLGCIFNRKNQFQNLYQSILPKLFYLNNFLKMIEANE